MTKFGLEYEKCSPGISTTTGSLNGPVPATLTAATLNEYSRPAARPVRVRTMFAVELVKAISGAVELTTNCCITPLASRQLTFLHCILTLSAGSTVTLTDKGTPEGAA